jgi:hypothetical protein
MTSSLLLSNLAHKGELTFVRDLTEAEMQTHLSHTLVCAGIRNLVTAFRMVEFAVLDWESHLTSELLPQRNFSNQVGCYKSATLLAMLYMLDEHVECEIKRLERAKKVRPGESAFWIKHRTGGGFLSLTRNMRNASQHTGLPIASFLKKQSATGTTLEIIFVAGRKGETINLINFRERLYTFMETVGRKELIPKLKEILKDAHDFYSSLIPNATKLFPGKLVLIEEVSKRTGDHIDVSLLEVPGRFFEALNIGFDA